jgi:hypothetical protein
MHHEGHQMKSDRDVSAHGAGAECPTCGKPELFEHPDGRLRHCFSCGVNLKTVSGDALAGVLDEVFRATHVNLLSNEATISELTSGRALHRKVLVDSFVGLVPVRFAVSDLFSEPLRAAREQLEVLRTRRGIGRPTKADKESIAIAEGQVNRLEQGQHELTEFFAKSPEQLVFFYSNSSHHIVRVKARSEGGAEVEWGTGGVFNHHLFAPGTAARSLEELRSAPVLVASEFDVLQLQSVMARLAEDEALRPEAGYLQAAALGLGEVDALTAKILGRMPLLIRDTARPTSGVRLVEEVSHRLNLHVAVVSNGDTLEQALHTQPLRLLSELAAAKKLVTRPFAEVRSDIDGWRFEKTKFMADRWASWELLTDLRERGKFFYDGRQAYVFEKETNQLFPVDPDNVDTQLFLARYGIYPADSFFKPALNGLRLAAQGSGTQTTVHSFSYYDVQTNRLYVFDHNQHVYRISCSKIEPVANGTDGVLFVRNPKWKPFVIGTPTGDAKAVVDTLLGSVRLKEDFLSRAHQALLFRSWLHAMMFPQLFPTRPILAMIGEKGSGKTSVLRRVGQLLFGPGFQVMGMTHEPKDFDAAVTGDAFVAIDNADADVKWLDDKLAVVATGGTLKRRAYYTTNNLVEFPITAFVGITSRTPHFRREDVADRLLLFHIEKLHPYEAEATLLARLLAQRNTLMTELVGELQRVLAAIHKTKETSYSTTFRIADFAQFVLRVADAEGKLPEAQTMFKCLGEEQLAFTVQDDPVTELLEDWVIDHVGEEVTSAQLFAALQSMASTSHPPRSFDYKSAVSFGQYLQSNRATLKALFGAEDRTARGRKRVWTFFPPASTPAEHVETPVGEVTEDMKSYEDDMKAFMEWAESRK